MSKKEKINFYLVGIGNHSVPVLSVAVLRRIHKTTFFSGGKRHYELVKQFLPEDHKWIEISGRMDLIFDDYLKTKSAILIFTSGDPFFYGFGNTLKSYLPKSNIKVFPYFNSIQRLCHKIQKNYSNLKAVSIHGRDWSALDSALIKNEAFIGILTDAEKTPSAIAERLLNYNFTNYTIVVGEELDGDFERIEELTLIECKFKKHSSLNCVLLERKGIKNDCFGIPDALFESLPNRPNMITKMPIRLTSIHMLHLNNASVFWDIGSCTGSVAIEAKRFFPHLNVLAFEKRVECGEIINRNMQQFSSPGINVVIDDFFKINLLEYPMPDVVFIGGHGNNLEEMLLKINQLNPDIRIVINAVKETTINIFIEVLKKLNYSISEVEIQVDSFNKIKIMSAINIKK